VSLRESLVRAAEALEDGDVRYAAAILRDALESCGGEPIETRRLLCPRCGLDCRWPGLLDHHLRFVHWDDAGAVV
jgi:hypothetical protein